MPNVEQAESSEEERQPSSGEVRPLDVKGEMVFVATVASSRRRVVALVVVVVVERSSSRNGWQMPADVGEATNVLARVMVYG